MIFTPFSLACDAPLWGVKIIVTPPPLLCLLFGRGFEVILSPLFSPAMSLEVSTPLPLPCHVPIWGRGLTSSQSPFLSLAWSSLVPKGQDHVDPHVALNMDKLEFEIILSRPLPCQDSLGPGGWDDLDPPILPLPCSSRGFEMVSTPPTPLPSNFWKGRLKMNLAFIAKEHPHVPTLVPMKSHAITEMNVSSKESHLGELWTCERMNGDLPQ